MKKFNVYLKYGLLINCIFLLINGSGIFPEFTKGICAGLGLTLIFMGMYFENHNRLPLSEYKRKIFNKFRGVIVMGNFINAAFPWVAFGIFIATYLTYIDSKKSKNKVK